MSRPKLRRAQVAVVVALLVSGLVSGCAGARPGVAAQVGDQVITLTAVDQATEDLCQVFLPQIKDAGQSYPLGAIRAIAVQTMTTRELASQVARAYGVKPTKEYDMQYAGQKQAALQLDENLRSTFLELSTAATYAESIQQQVGLIALKADGATSPTVDDQMARGKQIFTEWADKEGVELDPRFGLGMIDGAVTPTDTQVSTAVSAAALAGAKEQMDPAEVAALPADQRCG